MKKCSKCSAINPDNAKFCFNCGSKDFDKLKSNVKICPKCGDENLKESKFCHSCGASLDSTVGNSSNADSSLSQTGPFSSPHKHDPSFSGQTGNTGPTFSKSANTVSNTNNQENKKNGSSLKWVCCYVPIILLILLLAFSAVLYFQA